MGGGGSDGFFVLVVGDVLNVVFGIEVLVFYVEDVFVLDVGVSSFIKKNFKFFYLYLFCVFEYKLIFFEIIIK